MISMSTSSHLQDFESSRDGYIRLTISAFLDLQFDLRSAWLDEDLREELVLDDVPAYCAGYCEWMTMVGVPRASIGWAWFRSTVDGQAFLAPGGISTNVMLVTLGGQDLGTRNTDSLLQSWLSNQPWQGSEKPLALNKENGHFARSVS
jgi:hypothetical protein